MPPPRSSRCSKTASCASATCSPPKRWSRPPWSNCTTTRSSPGCTAAVPAELCAVYFEVGSNARYLSTVGRVRPEHRDRFAAAILAGDMVRVHAVDRDENPLYWQLLHAAGKASGLPVLYNTSFNLFGEPLVCTPRDA